MPPPDKGRAPLPAGLVILLIILVAVILIGGTLFYLDQEEQAKTTAITELTTIAKLKSEQIVVWREGRLQDAHEIMASPYLIDGIDVYLARPDADSEAKLRERFREINASRHYHNIVLVDQAGHVALTLNPSTTAISPETREAIKTASATGEPVMTDLHRRGCESKPGMDVIAPLFMHENGRTEYIGAIILAINPNQYLYPLVQSWPVPSESAETLLVERQGDNVLFLNDLRHMNHTAFNLTIPMTQTDLPAVMAVSGTTGAFFGRDYRNVEVISVLEPVHGTPWYMVAKIDTDEALAAWNARSVTIISLVGGILFTVFFIIAMLWERRHKQYYRSLYDAEAALREEEDRSNEIRRAGEQKLKSIVDSLPGAMIYSVRAWPGGERKIEFVSGAVEELHGCTAEEAIADANRIYDTFAEEERPAFDKDEEEAIGKRQTFTRIIRLRTKDGSPRWVYAASIPGPAYPDGSVVYDGVELEITEQKLAEEQLRQRTTDLEAAYEEMTATEEELRANYIEMDRNQKTLKASEARLRRFYDAGLFGVIFWNMDGKITDANDSFLQMTGYTREDLETGRIDWGKMTPPEFRQRDEESREELKTSGRNVVPFEKEYIRKDGSRLPILIAGAMLDERRYDGVAFVLNISGLKEAESRLAAAQQMYRELFENVSIGLLRTTPGPEGTIIDANPAAVRIFEADSREQFLALHPSEFYYDPGERKRVSDAIMGSGSVKGMEIQYRTLKGRRIWGRITAIRKTASDGSIYFDNTIEDITERKQAEEEIRSNNAFLDMIIDMSPFAMWVSDSTGTVIRVNRALCETIRVPPESIVGSYNALKDRNLEAQGVMPQVRAVFEDHVPARFSILWKAADAGDVDFHGGRDMYIDVSMFPILNPEGGLANVVCQWVDITDRRTAEMALKESEARFRTTLDALMEGCQIIGHDWKYLYVNDAVCRQGRKKKEDLLGRTMMEVYPGIEKTKLFPVLRRCMVEHVDEHVENEFSYPDGTSGLFDLIIEPAPEGIFILSIDITERKRAEEALLESEEKYRELFENITAGFALHDIILDDTGKPVDYRFLIVNEAFERMTHLNGADIVGRTVLEVLPLTEPEWIETYGDVALSGSPKVFERFSKGLDKWFEVRVYSPKRGQFATVFNDITDRKLIEGQREALIKELELKNAELERFTYTVSHDLKSPLITILGYAGLIEKDVLEGDLPQLKRDVGRITGSAEKMQQLLGDVLELSRIGRIISPPEIVPFPDIVHEAVDLLAGPVAERGAKVEIAPGMPLVNVDRNRIREVMVNLIENAVKYMGDQKEPLVRIGIEYTGEGPVFFVQDNGIGINPQYLTRIFNLFEKLDPATPGTGVGLTIVKRIIEVHGGRIWAESEGVGKGTSFRFTLPVPEGEERGQ